jgi:hypothetical protein
VLKTLRAFLPQASNLRRSAIVTSSAKDASIHDLLAMVLDSLHLRSSGRNGIPQCAFQLNGSVLFGHHLRERGTPCGRDYRRSADYEVGC